MNETKRSTESTAVRISTFVLAVIFITLALSLTALYLAFDAASTSGDLTSASYFLMIGFMGLALSTYMLFQTRRRVLRLAIKTPPIITTITCQKCGFKNVREFQRGDYVFKEVEPCQKCNEKTMISAIYREVKEKKKEETLS